MDGLLSELDQYAVEQALQLKNANTETQVTVLTTGPDQAIDAVRKALQMGAGQGVLVTVEAIAGSDRASHLAGARRSDQEARPATS